MAQRKLWTDRRSAVGNGLAVMLFSMVGCAYSGRGLGLSLGFYNKGTRPLTTKRFDFDEKKGPIPGYLGPSLKNGKYLSFMPGDRQDGIPKSVEAEWILHSDEFLAWSDSTPDSERYSKENREIYRKLWAANPHYIQRVDLIPILTPEIIQTVRADRLNTQLEMIVVFKDDKVEITAKPYRWRETP